MSDSSVRSNRIGGRVYYGWIVVASCFVMWVVAFGIQYSFGVFFKPIQETFGWSRATVSGAITISVLVYAFCLVPVGWAIDRINTRLLFSTGALLVGSALVLCSFVTQPWQLYLLYGLPLGIGISICGPVPMALIARWFTEKRGVALGIASAGIGVGTLIIAPLSNSLIAAYGWRNSYVILGIICGVLLLVSAYFFRSSPQGGANQQNAKVSQSGHSRQSAEPPVPAMSFRQAIRTRQLRLILLSQVCLLFALRMIMVHIAPYALDKGISPAAAALAIGTIGGVSILGRLAMGLVQDRIGPQRSMVICLTVQGASVLALPFIGSDFSFFAYAAVFGFTYGGDVPQTPAIVAQHFGLTSVGILYGLTQGLGNIGGGAFGPIVAGYVFDVTGSYTIVFLAAALGLFLAAFCIWRLRLPR